MSRSPGSRRLRSRKNQLRSEQKCAPRFRRLWLDVLEPRTLLAGDFVFVNAIGSTQIDAPHALAVDPAGNSYIAGEFRGSVDFDPGPGSFLLTTTPTPNDNADAFVAKYSPTGAFLWAQRIGSTNFDVAYDLALDPAGNLWVTGSYMGTVDFDAGPGTHTLTAVGSTGGFILKLDANGGFQWVGSIDSFDGESLRSISVDDDGNVLIAGQFNGTGDFDPGPGTFNLTSQLNGTTSTFDAFLTKIDNAGTLVWAKAWGGSFSDSANDVTADADGNAYVFGILLGNYHVSKFDAAGNLTWGKAFIGGNAVPPGAHPLQNGDIAVDGEGNVYTTAALQNTVDLDPGPGVANLTAAFGVVDAFTSKLDANGNYVWAVKQGGNNMDTQPWGMVVDSNGDVYTSIRRGSSAPRPRPRRTSTPVPMCCS